MQRKKFVNTRARFQRTTDARLFAGWLRHFGKNTLEVLLTRGGPMEPGEVFVFQVFGPGFVAMFQAKVAQTRGQEAVFHLLGSVQLLKSNEEMRVLMEGTTGTLMHECREYEVLFLDLSDKGAGILCPRQIPKDAKVELHIDSTQGQVVCAGEVRYCREEIKMPGQYRIGLRVAPNNRIDSARLQRLLQAEAA